MSCIRFLLSVNTNLVLSITFLTIRILLLPPLAVHYKHRKRFSKFCCYVLRWCCEPSFCAVLTSGCRFLPPTSGRLCTLPELYAWFRFWLELTRCGKSI